MNLHLLANFGSLGATANTPVPAIADQIFARNTVPNYIMPYDMEAVGVYAFGGLLLRGRINNPNLAKITPPNITPLNGTAVNRINEKIMDLRIFPLLYRETEEIVYEITNSGAGPTDTTVFTWLRKLGGFQPAPRGQIYTIRFTSTTASVASTWTDITTTSQFTLPQGIYGVIGGVYYAATALGFRCIFDGQFFRPGGLGFPTENLAPWEGQMNGGLGLWGTFNLMTPPRFQVFNGAAVAVHTIYLQVVKMS